MLVNGQLYRTLDLAPGQYNLRDFPFTSGANDVQLIVRDEAGRGETINLSFFSDIQLLQSGISIFSANLGFRQKRFGNFASTLYEDSPIFSGFYTRGVTDNLTLGGAAQVDRHNALFSSQAIVATGLGIFGAETAVDLNDREPTQVAFILSYRYERPTSEGRLGGFSADVQYRTRRFSPMEEAGTNPNRYSWDVTARYQTGIGHSAYVTVTGGYSWGRDGIADQRTAGASVTRRFGRINATMNYTYTRDDRGTENRAVFGISLPLGRRQSGRLSYDTRRNGVTADYNLQGFEGLGQTDVRAVVGRNDNGQSVDFDVQHYSNRFRAEVRHVYDHTDGATQEYTDVNASFGIGFADGTFALGRDAALLLSAEILRLLIHHGALLGQLRRLGVQLQAALSDLDARLFRCTALPVHLDAEALDLGELLGRLAGENVAFAGERRNLFGQRVALGFQRLTGGGQVCGLGLGLGQLRLDLGPSLGRRTLDLAIDLTQDRRRQIHRGRWSVRPRVAPLRQMAVDGVGAAGATQALADGPDAGLAPLADEFFGGCLDLFVGHSFSCHRAASFES